MPLTPDAKHGPSFEEGIVWTPQASDPTEDNRQSYVTGKGLVIREDGVVHAVGQGREAYGQPPVADREVDTPPGSPSEGDRVIVGGSPTGAFTGHAREIAQWSGSAWTFTAPKQGMVVFVLDENEPYKQTASSAPWAWSRVNTTGGGALPDATEVGQFLYSYNGSTFEIVKPVVADDGFVVTDDDGHIVVTETP
jgi:hypothetical protein